MLGCTPAPPCSQVVETENLTTLLVVVGKTSRGEWMQAYEQLSDFVVRGENPFGFWGGGGRQGRGGLGLRLGAGSRLP